MKKLKKTVFCLMAGIVNALFGAGGGIVAVSAFKSQGLTQKQAQASAVCLILPLSLISVVMYFFKGEIHVAQAVKYIPFGVIGALAGACVFSKIPNKLLHNLFSAFMIYSGIRFLMR